MAVTTCIGRALESYSFLSWPTLCRTYLVNYALLCLTSFCFHLSYMLYLRCLSFVRGLLTGKFKRDDPNTSATLAGTRLGWVAEKPSERAAFATPDIETLRHNENYWKLMEKVEAIGKQHGMCTLCRKIGSCKYKLFKWCRCRSIQKL